MRGFDLHELCVHLALGKYFARCWTHIAPTQCPFQMLLLRVGGCGACSVEGGDAGTKSSSDRCVVYICLSLSSGVWFLLVSSVPMALTLG